MASTVTIEPRTGQDAYGAPSYGSATQHKAHVTKKTSLVLNANGEQVQSGRSVHLMTATPILPTARLTLSTGDAGSTMPTLLQPPILAVERRSDQAGPHHVVVYLP